MKSESGGIVGAAGSVINWVLAGVQVDEILRYVNIALATITSIVTLAFLIWRWWKAASADGKIDKDEIEELGGIVKGGVDEIKENADNIKKGKEKQDGPEKTTRRDR